METQTQKRSTALKAISIVGFVAILIFGVWGLIQVARMVPNLFSSIGGAAVSLSSIFVPAERLEVSLETSNVISSVPFTISWDHTNKRGDGTYRLSYACRDGVTMQAPDERGAYQTVFCDTPFNLTNEEAAMKVVAFSDRNRFIDVPLKLVFTRLSDGEITASTETAITIENKQYTTASLLTATSTASVPATPVPTTPAPSRIIRKAGVETRNVYSVTTTSRVSDPNGRVDLSVQILETGALDPVTNVFTRTASLRRGSKGAVRFSVTNLGTKSAENWNFNAVVPTFPMYIYASDMQPVLGPGDSVEYTLGFDQADGVATNGILTVNIDPSSAIRNEISRDNNIARATFSIYQ